MRDVNTPIIDDYSIRGIGVKKLQSIAIYFILLALIIYSYSNGISSYESSLYGGSNTIFWALSILFYIMLITYAFQNGIHGVVIAAVLGKLVLVYYPFIIGYSTHTGDIFTHYGQITDIISSGYYNNNWYPLPHTLISELSIIMNVSFLSFINLITPILSILPFVFLYIIIKKRTTDLKLSGVVFLLSLIIPSYFYYLFFPNGWSIWFFPLVVYLIMSVGLSFRIVLLVLISCITLFHPLSALVIILLLIIFYFSKNYEHSKTITLPLILIPTLIFCTWTLSFSRFNSNIVILFKNIFGSLDNVSTLESRYERVSSFVNLDIPQLITIGIANYGIIIIIIIILSIIVVFSIKQIINKETCKVDYLGLIIIVFMPLILSLYFLSEIGVLSFMNSIASYRLDQYAIIFFPLLFVPFSVVHSKRKGITHLSCVLIVIVFIIGLFPSPMGLQTNPYLSQSDHYGYKWTFENTDSYSFYFISGTPSKLYYSLYGSDDMDSSVWQESYVGDHFSELDKTSTIHTNYILIITSYSYVSYTTVWKNYRFISEDFLVLYIDSRSNAIYSNNYYINYYIT